MNNRFQAEEQRIRDAYARRPQDSKYSWADPAHVFRLQSLERHALDLLARSRMGPLAGKRILEVGCGRGHWLREFVKWGAHPEDTVGVDLLSARIREARGLCAREVNLLCCSAGDLPLPDRSFDVVAQFTVFSSVLDPTLRGQIALEMLRVVKQRGLILWYDFLVNNPRNPDVRAVGRREIHALFRGCRVVLRRVTLAPPIARRMAPRSLALCSLLELVPLLRTHYLAAITKA